MPVQRRFLIASSYARLISRESTSISRLVEGYFPPRPGRTHLLRVERDRAVLVLLSGDQGAPTDEEQVEIPMSHAEALMDVAVGRLAWNRIPLPLPDERRGELDRFILPSGLNLLTTTAAREGGEIPLWFGTEVTNRPEFLPQALAFGAPADFEAPEITNAGLEALLDLLENRGKAAEAVHGDPSGTSSSVVQTREPETPEQRPPAPGLAAHSLGRPPSFRGQTDAPDERIVRLARSLAPRTAQPVELNAGR